MYKEEQNRARNGSLRESSTTGYSQKDFLSRTIQSCLLTRNEETAKNRDFSIRHDFIQKTSILNPGKTLNILHATVLSGSNLVKSPGNPIRNIVTRSAAKQLNEKS